MFLICDLKKRLLVNAISGRKALLILREKFQPASFFLRLIVRKDFMDKVLAIDKKTFKTKLRSIKSDSLRGSIQYKVSDKLVLFMKKL